MIIASLILMVVTTGYMCSSMLIAYQGPEDMRLGQRVIYQMMGEETLEHVGFFEAYPEATPSQWVEYINSEEGQFLWPRTSREFHRDHTNPMREHTPGRLLRPTDLEYSAYEPDPALGRQLVYIPDDEEGLVHIQGFDSPFDEPIHTWSYEFPSDASFLDLKALKR